jgi:hypothetical protein
MLGLRLLKGAGLGRLEREAGSLPARAPAKTAPTTLRVNRGQGPAS